MSDGRKTAYVNARIVDPATGFDGKGELLTAADQILDMGAKLFDGAIPDDADHGDERVGCLLG